MCGICGFYKKKPYELKQLKEINDVMVHRGPDDSGEEIIQGRNGYYIGMAHRRLSIIDLSMAGHQPMSSDNGRVTVVFNGEIYNFKKIRKEISDYQFHTSCDTEIIIAAYLKWGIKCVDHFNGMFAIALYDREDDSLYLIRDRIGKKPIYYWFDGTNGIVFASELKPIMKCPDFNEEIRTDILSRYLIKQYINSPDTIFNNVYKLESGHIIQFRYGQVKKWSYWDISSIYHLNNDKSIKDYEQAKYELKQILKESVKLRMITDVPLGAFLSGGYDSTLVAGIAQEVLGNERLNTFSIGFSEDDFDEAPFARQVAEILGTNHTEKYCDELDMLSLVESIPAYYDEPFADPSEIPTMLVSAVSKKDVTVVLSGDGGDELFCGYNIYDLMKKVQYLEMPAKIAGLVGGIGGLEKVFPNLLRSIIYNDDNTRTQIVPIELLEMADAFVAENDNGVSIKYEFEGRYRVNNYQIRRMLLDMDTYLPNDILTKVDRASMKYSLECRCPILDVNVIEYSFRLGQKFKYHNGEKKHILKDITHEYIPKAIMERPKKGFGVPLAKWLRGPLKEQIEHYSSLELLTRQGIFSPAIVNNFVQKFLSGQDTYRHSNTAGLLWSFFVFQQWYEYYIMKQREIFSNG